MVEGEGAKPSIEDLDNLEAAFTNEKSAAQINREIARADLAEGAGRKEDAEKIGKELREFIEVKKNELSEGGKEIIEGLLGLLSDIELVKGRAYDPPSIDGDKVGGAEKAVAMISSVLNKEKKTIHRGSDPVNAVEMLRSGNVSVLYDGKQLITLERSPES